MKIQFQCISPECSLKGFKFDLLEVCPACKSNLIVDVSNLNNEIQKGISSLPVHVSQPLFELYKTNVYFKRIHLISDVLLGFFRLYGHAIIQIANQNNITSESLEQSYETLFSKDSHGLWSSTISKILQEFAKQNESLIPAEFSSIFGIAISSSKQSIKRMTVKNTVIDSKGKKQQVEVTNTPIELLINFRNKYVGHGTVYSEEESKLIFDTYEPILEVFIESLNQCNIFYFSDVISKESIHSFNKVCSGHLLLDLKNEQYYFDSESQLQLFERVKHISGHFFCNNDSCDLGNTHVGLPAGGNCPICNHSLHIRFDKFIDDSDKKIINTYPYFIAHPYKRALEELDSFKKLHLLKETFLNYLKYLGLLTASEYFNCNLKIGEINRAFKNFLFRPQFGHWNAFMRCAIEALNINNHNWFVKELPQYYYEIETKPYEESGITSIGSLINFRNHHLGHGKVPDEKKSSELWNDNFKLLKELLLKMDFCKNYTIVSSDKTISYRLMGDEITQVNLRSKLLSNVALLNPSADQMNVVPFFILPGEFFIKEVSDKARLMIYEQNTGSRIVFFSPESIHGETNNEKVLEQLNLMIRDKEKREPQQMIDLNIDTWRNLLKENNEDTIQSLLSEKKVIKGIYQERQDAEIALRSWVGARAGLFFLSAEAGSGKTNLLVEMNRQYLDRGIDTILLRGNRFRTPDIWEEICYRLNLSDDFDIKDAQFLKYDQENPLIILIDGANENAASQKLFESILSFLEKNAGGHIKIVLSWRVNTKSELPFADDTFESIVYSDSTDKNRDDNLIARSCYWLKPLNKIEVEGAWNKYVNDKQDKIKRKPNFSYEELTYHDRSLSDQLDNPLLLRLFLEMYNGKGLPKSRGGFISIWTLYHEKLIAQ